MESWNSDDRKRASLIGVMCRVLHTRGSLWLFIRGALDLKPSFKNLLTFKPAINVHLLAMEAVRVIGRGYKYSASLTIHFASCRCFVTRALPEFLLFIGGTVAAKTVVRP